MNDKDKLIQKLEEEVKYLKTLVDRLLEGKGLTPVDTAARPAADAEHSINIHESGAEIMGGE